MGMILGEISCRSEGFQNLQEGNSLQDHKIGNLQEEYRQATNFLLAKIGYSGICKKLFVQNTSGGPGVTAAAAREPPRASARRGTTHLY